MAGFATGCLIRPEVALSGSSPTGDPDAGGWSLRRAVGLVKRWRWALLFAAAGMAADLDLLVGLHSQYTHSLGAAALVMAGALVLLVPRGGGGRAVLLSVALGAAYASHVLLDYLATDTTPPIGIMALWPFSHGYYLSDLHIFGGISRRIWLAVTWREDFWSIAREIVILLPISAAIWWLRRPSGTTAEP